MINEFLNMSGYGQYVWSSYGFTFIGFGILYFVTKVQFIKERKKFISKYGTLDSKKAEVARSQSINKEILSNSSNF